MIDPATQPFVRIPLEKPGLISRLLGREPKRNAFLRVNNLFAEAVRPIEVSVEEIAREIESYRVNLLRDFRHDLEDLYRKFLRHCLQDRSFGSTELEDLAHLKAVFGLNDTVGRIHEEVVTEVYSENLLNAMRDGRLEDDERAFLEKLKNSLVVPEELRRQIHNKAVTDRLQSHLDQALRDQRLSPEESEEIDAIAKSFGVQINLDDATTAQLIRYRLYWLIESGEPPTIAPGINLQKKEVCYFATEAEWYEHRVVTTRVRYAGPTARIRIAKGLYFRAGEIAFQPVTSEGLRQIDTGRLFLTNKRLIFMGTRKNTNIRISRILDFTPYRNGVGIQKDSGKSPFLKFDRDIDLFVLYLHRALADSG